MTQDKFIALTHKGEGTQIEYKTCTEEISESLYESVCSFLNHTGGQILVGVQDDGTIVGVNPDRVEKLKTNIINCINNPELFLPCPYFTPRILVVDGKTVMLLDIPCGQYVYRYKGRYWDRNDDEDIDVTDQPGLLLSIFERKNPHLFEERIVEGLTMEQLDKKTFQYCRNILATIQPSHAWLQMTDEEILLSTHLAKMDGGKLQLKYAALILYYTLKSDKVSIKDKAIILGALGYLISPLDVVPDAIPIAGLSDDLAVLIYVLHKVWGEVSEDVKQKAKDKLYTWFDEDELQGAENLFQDDPSDNPV